MSQNAEILSYLSRGNALTPIEALRRFGCFRLGARIWELREQGYEIDAELVKVNTTNGKTLVAQYSLSPDKPLKRHHG